MHLTLFWIKERDTSLLQYNLLKLILLFRMPPPSPRLLLMPRITERPKLPRKHFQSLETSDL